MFTTIKGNHVHLYQDSGSIIRRYSVSGNVLQATCSGTEQNGSVAILTETGWTFLYDTRGAIIRRVKAKK